MKFLCDAKKFYESIANGEDREMFCKEYGKPERFERGIQVSLPNAKTLTQNGAIWRDFEIVGNLMFCNKEYVYYALLKADEFQDIWLDRINGKWIFHTLSMLDKKSTALFITRYREFLQAKVNESYGEWIPIDWSKREEIGEMK